MEYTVGDSVLLYPIVGISIAKRIGLIVKIEDDSYYVQVGSERVIKMSKDYIITKWEI